MKKSRGTDSNALWKFQAPWTLDSMTSVQSFGSRLSNSLSCDVVSIPQAGTIGDHLL